MGEAVSGRGDDFTDDPGSRHQVIRISMYNSNSLFNVA